MTEVLEVPGEEGKHSCGINRQNILHYFFIVKILTGCRKAKNCALIVPEKITTGLREGRGILNCSSGL